MAFNLSKFCQAILDAPNEALGVIGEESEKADDQLNSSDDPLNQNLEETSSELLSVSQETARDGRAAQIAFENIQKLLQNAGFDGKTAHDFIVQNDRFNTLATQAAQFNLDTIPGLTEGQKAGALAAAEGVRDYDQLIYDANGQIQNWMRSRQELQQIDEAKRQQPMMGVAFNLKKHKIARNEIVRPDQMSEEAKGAFIQKYLDPLIQWQGHREQVDQISEQMKQELNQTASPIVENDINDALESIQTMGIHDSDQGAKLLGLVFDKFVSSKGFEALQIGQTEQMGNTMSNTNPKGIIKFNLTDHILENKITKTASAFQSQEYLLYGPTEKRVCPKLRGKRSEGGDVVSEYICRHHCLDGLVIDDNKTICGEALWRANVMDKYSREYVNADGDIEGGYLNKRFEINRNVPEENKIRLKPGETRKPRPASMGSLESRMQDMRNKEADKRGYKPDSNKGEPFEWCHDADQNNVEVAQSERDRREEAMGHQTVQYTNKNEQENNPKVASKGFNLKLHKTAAVDMSGRDKHPRDSFDKGSPSYNHCWSCKKRVPSNSLISEDSGRGDGSLVSICPACRKTAAVENDTIKKVEVRQFPKEGFNLKSYKSATIPDDGYADGGAPYTDEEMDIIDKNETCPKCHSTQRKGTPCKCSSSTPKEAQTIPLPEDGTPIKPKEKKIRDDDHTSRKLFGKEKKSFNLKSFKIAKNEIMSSEDIRDKGFKDSYIESYLDGGFGDSKKKS